MAEFAKSSMGGRYLLALVEPEKSSASGRSLLDRTCRWVSYDNMEEAETALRIALKRAQFGESIELMISSGYSVSDSSTLQTVMSPRDIGVVLAYPRKIDSHNPMFWQTRLGSTAASRHDRGTPRGPIVYYGGKSQLAIALSGDNAPKMTWNEANSMGGVLFSVAQISMIG